MNLKQLLFPDKELFDTYQNLLKYGTQEERDGIKNILKHQGDLRKVYMMLGVCEMVALSIGTYIDLESNLQPFFPYYTMAIGIIGLISTGGPALMSSLEYLEKTNQKIKAYNLEQKLENDNVE
ncbi:MAG: hypothetical protein ABIF40_04400 [archaeon]